MNKIVVHFDFSDERIDELKEEAYKAEIGLYDLIENKLTECGEILGADWTVVDYKIK